jgi:hypothetical protein
MIKYLKLPKHWLPEYPVPFTSPSSNLFIQDLNDILEF